MRASLVPVAMLLLAADATPPRLWGSLEPGPFGVGFRRQARGGTIVDVWYPADGGSGRAITFGDYLRSSDDLRGAQEGFPASDEAVRRTLSAAITGDPAGLPATVTGELLSSPMMARRDAVTAAGRFPLVMWTPRYATTSAQAVLLEYLASHGLVVAFARPAAPAPLPFELKTAAEKVAELSARVGDMHTAVADLERRPGVDATAIGVVAWSYAGEMATAFQLVEPRVTFVAGLSTTLLDHWVFQDEAALAALDPSRLTAAYAVLTQGMDRPRPPLLDRLAVSYFLEFPGLAHGSFNALEGYVPSLAGIAKTQPWSRSGPDGARGYAAAATLLERLLRHHVAERSARPLAPSTLTAGLPAGVVSIRSPGPRP